MLEALMEVLDGVIRPEDVVVLIATGTHRASTTQERRDMVGADVMEVSRRIKNALDPQGILNPGAVL
jgi:nickel-dependent lactate racemase